MLDCIMRWAIWQAMVWSTKLVSELKLQRLSQQTHDELSVSARMLPSGGIAFLRISNQMPTTEARNSIVLM
jgi:hypothetical protein